MGLDNNTEKLKEVLGLIENLPNAYDDTEIREELDKLKPLAERTYTDLYYGANSYNGGYFPFLLVKPKDPSKLIGDYKIKFQITTTAEAYPSYSNTSVVELWLYRNGSLCAQSIFNSRCGSYLHYYVDVVHCTSNDCFAQYGSLIGVSITSGNNYNSASYKRTSKVTLLEIGEDLEWSLEDNGPLLQYQKTQWYTDVVAAKYTVTNTTCNAVDVGLQETGDANTVTYDQFSSFDVVISPSIRLAYGCIFGFDANHKAQAVSAYNETYNSYTTSINQARVYGPDGYRWQQGLFFTGSWSNYAQNQSVALSVMTQYSGIDFRYTDNCIASSTANELGLVRAKSVYLKGVIKEDGLFYLRPFEVTYNSKTYKRTWTQDIPTEREYDDEGYQYVYWYLGEPYYASSYAASGYNLNFAEENKMFWFDGESFTEYDPLKAREWYGTQEEFDALETVHDHIDYYIYETLPAVQTFSVEPESEPSAQSDDEETDEPQQEEVTE